MVHQRVEADSLFELIATLLSASTQLTKFLNKQGFSTPTLTQPAPTIPLVAENEAYFDAKNTIVEAAEQLIRLIRGPRDHLLALSFEPCATTSLQVALKYKFANHIPIDGSKVTYGEIANAVGQRVTPALVERIIQHCSSFGLFEAMPGGFVAHNTSSALLVTDPDLESWMELSATIAFPAGACVPKAIDQYGYSMEANESAYGVSIGQKISQFSHFRQDPKHHQMFARAMRGISSGGAYDIVHAIDGGYPWHELESGHGHLVVDVGGGPGHVSMALAKKYTSLRFEVQDLPETVKVGAESCPEASSSRVTFRPHDFMTPQPTHDVGEGEGIAYFCRFILHDWSDKYAREILQQLAYGLRQNDRIILNEVLVPEPGQEPREIERRMHDRDLLMLMNLNGRERSLSAFQEICQSVTPKLRIQRTHRPKQGELSLIEITLDGFQLRAESTLDTHAATNGVKYTDSTNGTNGVNGTNGIHMPQAINAN